MSSLIEVSTPSSASPAGANRNGAPQIIHFDATQRRKEKLRQKALNGQSAATADAAAAPAAASEIPQPPAAETGPPAAGAAAAGSSPAVSAASATPDAPPQPSAQPDPSGNAMSPRELEGFLVNFVVEQTGYPTEMVELDADLEADLGIDSIKKAQLFGELAEYFEVQASDDLSLDDFPTLRHVMNFLEGVPQKSSAASASSTAAAAATPAAQPASTPPAASTAPPPAAPSAFLKPSAQPAETSTGTVPPPSLLANGSLSNGSLTGAPPSDGSLSNAAVRPQTGPTSSAVALAAAAPAATAAPAAAAPSGMSSQELESFLIQFVVEQTGYPPEMVELDADLEADLGIDSIKKAQLFGELAEHFEVTASDDLSLDDFPTLRHVTDFLKGAPRKGESPPTTAAPAAAASMTTAPAAATAASTAATAPPATTSPQPTPSQPTTSAPPQPAATSSLPTSPPPQPRPASPQTPATVAAAPSPATPPATAAADEQDLETFLVNFVVEQTGYPPEMVELDADLEADLGIDSIKKAQLFGELAEYFEVQPSEDLSLDDFPTLRHVMNFLKGVPRRTTP